eukprot:TRINITY_DN1389_c0_g1_i1.p1 TRINITY_DN1389_c0_g1~~TRINITY_DN1389_c0_g1_i1.p1  ORF type:complete len:693 (-),score=223.12 TRINITY_DN1389_c0_g1_i1:34-2112(-)
MTKISLLLLLAAAACAATRATALLRAPGVPLVVNNPWFSIWSMADHLYDTWPAHGPSNEIAALCGLIRVDGVTRRFMGIPGEVVADPFTQKSVTVRPRTTVYEFEDLGVHLTLTFMSAALPQDLEVLSRPVTYLTFNAWSVDGQDHEVQVYYDNTAEMGVSQNSELVTWQRLDNKDEGLSCMQMGASQQNPLKDLNDRISWGWFVVCHEDKSDFSSAMASSVDSRKNFSATGYVPAIDDTRKPRAASDNWPVLAVSFKMNLVGSTMAAVSKSLILAYDDVQAANYFGEIFVPYWRRFGEDASALVVNASRDFELLKTQVEVADSALEKAAFARGGAQYQDLISLIYRQALGGCNLGYGTQSGRTWYWLKEISSCSCFQTADVIYPFAPILLYENPMLLYKTIEPLLVYANNETYIKYNLEWAPHHLGRYPVGDLTPDKQEQMPIEESGNLILMLADIAKTSNDASFIPDRFWPLLETWAQFLNATSLDPGNQLCTDDFEGPSPHNANLALKGMEAMAAYALLLRLKGGDYAGRAPAWEALAKDYASKWVVMDLDGASNDHYKLEYDINSTWSLKYNVWWQKRLGLDVFSDADMQKEFSYYATKFNKFGVPLDSRKSFAKDDWSMWTAAVSPKPLFESIVSGIWNFANTSPDRFALTDWYDTVTADRIGFHCRPVVGGFFAPLLVDQPFPMNE